MKQPVGITIIELSMSKKWGCTLSYAKEKKQKAIADSYPLASSLSSFSANTSAQKTCMVRKETCFTCNLVVPVSVVKAEIDQMGTKGC